MSSSERGSEDETRLLAEEATEFDKCQTPKAREDSLEEIPASLANTLQASMEGQLSILAKSLKEGFENLRKALTDGMRTSHQNLTSCSECSGSESGSEEKHPPPKQSKRQELSDDDVTKEANEFLISTSNKQTRASPATNWSQSTVLARVADELNEENCGPEV